jgi:hypothetical protein
MEVNDGLSGNRGLHVTTIGYNPSTLKLKCWNGSVLCSNCGGEPDDIIVYDCTPNTITVTISGVTNNGSTYCSGYTPPNDYDPSDINGVHVLTKVSGCLYEVRWDSGGGPGDPIVYWFINVVISETVGYVRVYLRDLFFPIELPWKPFEYKWNGSVPNGAVGIGGTYSNELTDTDNCHENGHGGTAVISA